MSYLLQQHQDQGTGVPVRVLLKAINDNNVQIFKDLLQRWPVDQLTGNKDLYISPLALAAKRGHMDMVKILVEDKKVDIREQSGNKQSHCFKARIQLYLFLVISFIER